jgi:hypothetical protein
MQSYPPTTPRTGHPTGKATQRRGPHFRTGRCRLAAAGLVALMAFASPAAAQSRLDSLEPYLMDREAEIDLARSAAPHGIGSDAAILVLTADGYVEAAPGSNGFTCFVGRGWSGQLFAVREGERVIHPDVLDPELRAPHCFNAPASRTILPLHHMRTRLLLEGRTIEEIAAETGRAARDGRLEEPGRGAFAYMMSARQRLGAAGAFRPHVMLYVPGVKNEAWGAPGFTPDFPFVAEAGTLWAIVVIPTPRFSDGSRPEGSTGS